MENIDKGLTVPKWVLINRPKIPQIPKIYLPKLSVQAQIFGISMKKDFIGRPQSMGMSNFTRNTCFDIYINNVVLSQNKKDIFFRFQLLCLNRLKYVHDLIELFMISTLFPADFVIISGSVSIVLLPLLQWQGLQCIWSFLFYR